MALPEASPSVRPIRLERYLLQVDELHKTQKYTPGQIMGGLRLVLSTNGVPVDEQQAIMQEARSLLGLPAEAPDKLRY